MRLTLIDGQGNFGSIDGDRQRPCVTPRPLGAAATEMLEDIDKDTVDFHPNYDAAKSRPSCRRASRICSSMAPEASRSAWRRTFRRTIWARWWTRHCGHRQPGRYHRRADQDRPRTGFPDRRRDSRPRRHPLAYEHGPRLHHHPRQGRTETAARGPTHHRHEIPYQVIWPVVERIAKLVSRRRSGVADLRDESDRKGIAW